MRKLLRLLCRYREERDDQRREEEEADTFLSVPKFRERFGLTPDERRLSLLLGEAHDLHKALPVAFPEDEDRFGVLINECQNIIAWRVAARVNPRDWYQHKA